MYRFGQLSLERMKGVDKSLIEVAMRALRKSARRHDGGIEEQNELFKKGVSKADGFNKPSYHQTGLAIDVIPYVTRAGIKGNAIYSKKINEKQRMAYFNIVAVCMLQAASESGVKLTWGGNWQSFNDQPHYQIPREGA